MKQNIVKKWISKNLLGHGYIENKQQIKEVKKKKSIQQKTVGRKP